ncbi:hypothetical protein NA56DRAFT_642514 [Hyaloscypha hepaticicola]|uniref:Uncharacterized protein n=1 Tax=Hyaloscypha hepaticicola TaxID=2082293 RepID=A0A2J6QH05_9HELO|nr:hypothetical protein NA56DRAFT_642514 [Hyaloscypha hepaticicola]
MGPEKKGSSSRNNPIQNRPDDTQPPSSSNNHAHLANSANISKAAPAPASANDEIASAEVLGPAVNHDPAAPEDIASQPFSSPDPNESAIDSQSEDSSASQVIDSRKLNKPSLEPAPLFVRPAAALPASPRGSSVSSPIASTTGSEGPDLMTSGRNVASTSAPGIESPQRIINGIQVNSPSAKVAPLFSGPPPSLPDDGTATQATTPSRNVFSDSGSEISHPAEIFSDPEEGELGAVAHATTPNTTFSPLSTRQDCRPTISPTPAPTAPPPQALEETENAAPNPPNPYFNAADNREGNLLYPEPEDPRDRAAIMPIDPNATPALRRHRSERTQIENAKFAAELAMRKPPPNSDTLLRHFKAKEISEFQRYAEDNPHSGCVKMGMKALEAALEKEREQMAEHLQLVNANRELAERMAMSDQAIKRAMEDAARQRKVGQYSEEDMENAVLDERDKRREVEARLKQMEKTAALAEFVDKKYAEEHVRALDAEQRVREDAGVIQDLRTQVKEKDAEIQTLLGEKGHLISTEQCAEFNAKVLRSCQDEITSLQTQLGESQSKVDDLYSALEAMKAKLGASSYSNVSDTDEHLVIEEQCEKRWETAIENLWTDNEALSEQLEIAQEIIRLYQEATSETPEGGVPDEGLLKQLNNAQEALQSYQKRKSQSEDAEAPYHHLSVVEELAHLQDQAERNNALIETQQQLLMRRGALGGDSVSSEDIGREYRKLRTEIWAKNKGIAEQAAYAESLESERINLLHSQEVLRQTNDELRTELDTMKSKFKEIKSDRDALKEELRGQEGPSSGLASKGYKDESYEDPKLFESLERNREYERTIMSLNKEIEGYATKSASTQAEIVELQSLIEDPHLKIAVGNNNFEEATKHLEAKILALNEARERQIQRQARNIKELENAETESGESPVSPKPSPFKARSYIPASVDAIDVVLLRCEIQLGQVQARRRRWGFMEGDAAAAIEIAIEAQGIAEQLDDSTLIGRAWFWRGIAEFMTGNSTAAELYFEISASYHWTQKGGEGELLQTWWNVSKTELVDKTTPIERGWLETHTQKRIARKKSKSDEDKSKDRMKKRAKKIKIKSAHSQSPTAARLAAPADSPVTSGKKQVNSCCSTQ